MIVELLLAASAVAPAPEMLRQEVICAETGFSRAAEAKDKDAFLSFVDPDARFIAGSVARGRAEIGEAWSGLFAEDGPTIRWRPAIVEVTIDGQLAISRGPYRTTQTDEKGEIHHSWGHFNSTWRLNEAGVWQVLFDSGGDAGMEPSEEDIAVLESEPDCA